MFSSGTDKDGSPCKNENRKIKSGKFYCIPGAGEEKFIKVTQIELMTKDVSMSQGCPRGDKHHLRRTTRWWDLPVRRIFLHGAKCRRSCTRNPHPHGWKVNSLIYFYLWWITSQKPDYLYDVPRRIVYSSFTAQGKFIRRKICFLRQERSMQFCNKNKINYINRKQYELNIQLHIFFLIWLLFLTSLPWLSDGPKSDFFPMIWFLYTRVVHI